jgi:hypothetical protein
MCYAMNASYLWNKISMPSFLICTVYNWALAYVSRSIFFIPDHTFCINQIQNSHFLDYEKHNLSFIAIFAARLQFIGRFFTIESCLQPLAFLFFFFFLWWYQGLVVLRTSC